MQHRLNRVCSWLTGSVLLLVSAVSASADDTGSAAAVAFAAGREAYEAADFEGASTAFEQASTAVPGNDEYVYWLGKAYGRRAERAGWFDAMRYAQRTREALERAVALNPENADAVRDLADFYSQAPGFLGGDSVKAAALRERLKTISAHDDPG
jgi:tetratricopeptide (TPR) repeat protein